MPSNHLILCHPPLLLPSIFPTIRAFSNEVALNIRWPRYQSFSFSISSSDEYSVLISFRMHWFDFLAVQGLSRVFSSTTIQKHQFFAFSLLYGTNLTSIHDSWKNYNFDYMDLCGKSDVSAFLNNLSMFVIAFLSKSKCLNFMAAVTACNDFGPQENKIYHCFHFFPIYLP